MIYLAYDHAGFELAKQIKQYLESKSLTVEDIGPQTFDPGDDYPDYAINLAKKVGHNPDNFGILLCRSGAGMAIAANKVKGSRAVVCQSPLQAKKAREHNNANILVLAADFTQMKTMETIINTFFNTPFSNEQRHIKRLLKISQFEEGK